MLDSVVKIKLVDLLKTRGKSLYALHVETGISYNTLIRIKQNKVKSMSFNVLEKVCENLGCNPSDLLAIEK